jgi:hypothetical protein
MRVSPTLCERGGTNQEVVTVTLLVATCPSDITRMPSPLWPSVAMGSRDVHGGSSLLPKGHDSNGQGYDITQDHCY